MFDYVRLRELERDYRRSRAINWLFLAVSLLCVAAVFVFGSEVEWSRFRGRVKGINAKTSSLTIENREGDFITVKVDQDVQLERGRDTVKLMTDLAIDDKVVLLYLPKAPPAKDEEPPPGGVYK